MPLVPCPDCQRSISDAAPACPHCGRPANAPATGPAPVPATEQLSPDLVTTFVRTLLHATFRPVRFFAAWPGEPVLYERPVRMLLVSGVVGGIFVTVSLRFVPHPGRSPLPKLVQDILSGVTPLVTAWLIVIANRFAPRLVGLRTDWATATRIGAFGATAGLVFTPLGMAAMLLSGSPYGTLPIGATVAVGYGALALRALGLTRVRAFLGSLAAYVVYLALWFVTVTVLITGLFALGTWLPELRPPPPPAVPAPAPAVS